MTSLPKTSVRSAFSILEIVIAIAVVGVLATIGVLTVTKVKPAAETSKLRSDVQNINSAIKVYLHSGGDLKGIGSAAEVIGKLKTMRKKDEANTFVGFTGSMIDQRTSLLRIDASASGPRAIYDPSQRKFLVTTDPVEGYKFRLWDTASTQGPVEESRNQSALEYASTSTWVWDYEEVPPPDYLNPTLVTRTDPGNPAGDTPTGVPDPDKPSEAVLEKLLPPRFSLPSDSYDIGRFPMEIALTDPNGPGDGKIIFGIITRDNWEWTEYSAPIQVEPADKVLAFVESLKPQEFHHSDPTSELYSWQAGLEAPSVTADPVDIDSRSGSTTITITHSNDENLYAWNDRNLPVPSGAFLLQYQLIPLENGRGTATAWTDYVDPFDVGGPQFPDGFEVVARVTSTTSFFTNSQTTRSSVTTFYQLDSPVINSSVDTLTSETDRARIELENPNPKESSELIFRILDRSGQPTSDWITYQAPFEVAADDFPAGFTVAAKSIPLDPFYRESTVSNRQISVNFFGIEVTGQTIFILDSSGSMNSKGRMVRLKNATNAVLRQFSPGDQFAIIDYDSSARVITEWGYATPERVEQASASIQSVQAGGLTNYELALQAGIDANATSATQVIFQSDGFPNPNPSDPEDILSFVDQFKAFGIEQFDTVALGTDQAILGDMASRGDGTRIIVTDQ